MVTNNHIKLKNYDNDYYNDFGYFYFISYIRT